MHSVLLNAHLLGPTSTGWTLVRGHAPPVFDAPHLIRPDLTKLGVEPVLLEDDEWEHWVLEKRSRLVHGQLVLRDPTLDSMQSAPLVEATQAFFQRSLPCGPIAPDGTFPWLGGYRPASQAEFWDALSMSLQEDFAVMLDTDSRGLRAVILSVSFPSGWNPVERLGQSMAALHEPVADNALLQASMGSMSKAMTEKGPFVRRVWTLAGSNAKARPPGANDTRGLSDARQLWFRHERQVTLPLGAGACLFLIRVLLAPYTSVVRTPEDHRRLVSSLASMSEDTIAYKQLAHARQLVMGSA